MIDVSFVKESYKTVLSHIEKMEKQTAFATSRAINETLKIAQNSVKQELESKFDNPTRWAVNSTRIIWSSRSTLQGAILPKADASMEERTARAFLIPNVEGGHRIDKLHERWLKNNRPGTLGARKQLIQSKHAPKNRHGNLTGARYTSILSALNAQNDPNQNSRNQATRNFKRYFWAEMYGVKGVFERRKGRKNPLPMLIETDRQRYKPIIKWSTLLDRTVEQNYQRIFEKEYLKAISTAR